MKLVALAVLVGRTVLTAGIVTACARKWTCDLDLELRQEAGPGAIDCGRASGDSGAPVTEEDASADGGPSNAGAVSPVDECITRAFERHEAAFAVYPLTGKNAKLVYGVASTEKGTLTVLQYDPGADKNPTIGAKRCVSPEVDLSAARNSGSPAPFQCASLEELGETCGEPTR
jgi:hypothetical protein